MLTFYELWTFHLLRFAGYADKQLQNYLFLKAAEMMIWNCCTLADVVAHVNYWFSYLRFCCDKQIKIAFIISFLWFKSINGKTLSMKFIFVLVFYIDWKNDHENLVYNQWWNQEVFVNVDCQCQNCLHNCVIKGPVKYVSWWRFKFFQNLIWIFSMSLWSIFIP